MKIYFSGSVQGKKKFLEYYLKIIEALQEMGHEVIYQYLLKANEDKIKQQSIEAQVEVHQQLAEWKKQADIIVAELSYRSFAQGQEIAHAFRIGKPVLGLHVDGHKPHLILSDAGDRLLLSQYTLVNLKQVIAEGINYLNPDEQKRFTLLLPSHLVDYLDRVARDTKYNRSEYLRKILEEDMVKRRR